MKLKASLLTAFIAFGSFQTLAADSDGKFAAKGAGRKSCAEFSEAFGAKSSEYYAYGGWIEGYLSAFNSYQQSTYDIAPWQTTELMMYMLVQHCKTDPDARLLTAVNSMIKSFAPGRLQEEDELVEINLGQSKSYFHTKTIKEIRQALIEQGYDISAESDSFDSPLAEALLAYQKQKGIKETGLPDQQTLVNLLLIPSN